MDAARLKGAQKLAIRSVGNMPTNHLPDTTLRQFSDNSDFDGRWKEEIGK